MDEEYWTEFSNVIKMDDENIEKFKILYGEGQRLPLSQDSQFYETKLSFSQIIPEVQKNESDKEWFDNSRQDALKFIGVKDSELIGKTLANWRIDHWGSSSDLLYDDGPSLQTLEGLLKGEYAFYTLRKPPIKVYEKMAADGLVFETTWGSDADDEWAIGKGQVVDGQFQYHIGPMTGSQKMDMISIIYGFMDSGKIPNDIDTIVVENREHLDQLLGISLCLFIDYTIFRNNVLDLNFLDVSNVTDLSNLFANIDVYPCTEDDDTPSSEEGGFCNIRLDISKWNVSNVTKMAHLLDNDRIDLGDLSKWDRSKVTDC